MNPDSRFGISSDIDGWTRGDLYYYTSVPLVFRSNVNLTLR